MVVTTVLLFLSLNTINEWFFGQLEYSYGINWVFLPAGMRLLATLLFGTAGFTGLFISGLLLNFFHFTFDDPVRAVLGALAGSLGAYLVYLLAQRRYGLRTSLANLTPRRLMLLIVVCSMASPLLHHLVFAYQGHTENIVRSYLTMFIGDFMGTLLVIYTIKGTLAFLPSADRVRHRPMLMNIYKCLGLT